MRSRIEHGKLVCVYTRKRDNLKSQRMIIYCHFKRILSIKFLDVNVLGFSVEERDSILFYEFSIYRASGNNYFSIAIGNLFGKVTIYCHLSKQASHFLVLFKIILFRYSWKQSGFESPTVPCDVSTFVQNNNNVSLTDFKTNSFTLNKYSCC